MKLRLIAAAALAAIALSACGGPSLAAGHVVSKEYQPAYTFVELFPIYGTTCSGNPPVCTTYLQMLIPWVVYQPADWRLQLQDGKLSGWTYVTEYQYNRARLGQWWGSRNAQRPAAKQIRKNCNDC